MLRTSITFLVGGDVQYSVMPDTWSVTDTPHTCRIHVVYSGNAVFRTPRETFSLTPGKLYYFPPNLPFRAEIPDGGPFTHTYFDFYMNPPLIGDGPVSFDAHEGSILRHLIEAAEGLMTAYPDYRVGSTETPLTACLCTILSCIAESGKITYAADPLVLDALNLIHASYRSPIRVTEIAKSLGYSEDYLIRRFREVMRITPYAYILSLKQHEARYLKSSGMKSADIAQTLGYSDSAALCHALKNRF